MAEHVSEVWSHACVVVVVAVVVIGGGVIVSVACISLVRAKMRKGVVIVDSKTRMQSIWKDAIEYVFLILT